MRGDTTECFQTAQVGGALLAFVVVNVIGAAAVGAFFFALGADKEPGIAFPFFMIFAVLHILLGVTGIAMLLAGLTRAA
jgi:hypothetical protein